MIGLLKNNQPIIAALTADRKLRELSLDNTRTKARPGPERSRGDTTSPVTPLYSCSPHSPPELCPAHRRCHHRSAGFVCRDWKVSSPPEPVRRSDQPWSAAGENNFLCRTNIINTYSPASPALYSSYCYQGSSILPSCEMIERVGVGEGGSIFLLFG